MNDSEHYFQRGFGLREEAGAHLAADYGSATVDLMRAQGGLLVAGRLTFRLAREFGFCYGVERAVEYAYETLAKFPDRRVFLTNELIHNPHVSERMLRQGIRFLDSYEDVGREDVVIIPAFGVTVIELAILRKKGCIIVDTTCGSVLNVWKNVERYAREGLTTIIHGRYSHEETLATCSRATKGEGAQYIVVRDMAEAEEVARFIETPTDGSRLVARFRPAVSIGFDPARDLGRVGLANQSTMLLSESVAIGARLRQAFVARHGEEETSKRFHTFDTICSATQERQEAVAELLAEPLDLMIVIGGYNSSNTNHLAEMCEGRVRAFHIEDESCLLDATHIRHKPVHAMAPEIAEGWLPEGPVDIGLTAGASTPNNKIGLVVERVLGVAGIPLPQLHAPASCR